MTICSSELRVTEQLCYSLHLPQVASCVIIINIQVIICNIVFIKISFGILARNQPNTLKDNLYLKKGSSGDYDLCVVLPGYLYL